MTAELAPIIVGSILGSILVLAGIFWQQRRPWDIFYKLFFTFFGLFFLITTFGASYSLLSDYPLNVGSSPSIYCPLNGVCEVAFFNSTGNLMSANTTSNGTVWSVYQVAAQSGIPASVKNLTQTNIANLSYMIWIFLGIFITFGIVEFFILLHDIIMKRNEKRGGEEGS